MAGLSCSCSGTSRHAPCSTTTRAAKLHPHVDRMKDLRTEAVITAPGGPHARLGLALLMCCQIVACCLSLVQVAGLYHGFRYVMFDTARLPAAVFIVALYATVSILFAFARF